MKLILMDTEKCDSPSSNAICRNHRRNANIFGRIYPLQSSSCHPGVDKPSTSEEFYCMNNKKIYNENDKKEK